MKKRIALSISISLFLLLIVPAASAQTETNDFILSITVEQNLFSLARSAKVRVKIENQSGHTVAVKELRSISINLTRYERNSGVCWRDDCLGASFPLRNRSKLKNGESVQFEVNLADLYWKDVISSN